MSVFDLGYRGYEGARTSRWRRRRAIFRDGVRISLGLGRGAGAKVAPWLLIAVAQVPVAVLIVIASFAASLGGEDADLDLPSYAEYYGFAIVPIGLFAAIVAPLLLCPDRRDGVLSLYASRPITALDYVGARWAAFLAVATCAAWLPELILFVWNLLDAASARDYLADEWDVVPRLLAAGIVVAGLFTTLAMTAASFAARRAYAAVTTLAVLFVGSAIGGIAEDNFSGGLADALSLAALPRVAVDAARWIFGDEEPGRPLSGGVYTAWAVGVTVALAALLVRRTKTAVTT